MNIKVHELKEWPESDRLAHYTLYTVKPYFLSQIIKAKGMLYRRCHVSMHAGIILVVQLTCTSTCMVTDLTVNLLWFPSWCLHWQADAWKSMDSNKFSFHTLDSVLEFPYWRQKKNTYEKSGVVVHVILILSRWIPGVDPVCGCRSYHITTTTKWYTEQMWISTRNSFWLQTDMKS